MIIDYPFKYKVMNVTSTTADFLGFLEYDDANHHYFVTNTNKARSTRFLNLRGEWQKNLFPFGSKSDAFEALNRLALNK